MKIFRTIAVLAAVFTMTAALQAENYRILYVNTDSVRIGGRMLSAGDIFKETEDIQWTEDLQSIKVIGTDSRQILVLVAKEMEGKNKKSVFDYLMPVNAMSMAYRSEIFSIIFGDTDTTPPIPNTEYSHSSRYLLDTLFLPVLPDNEGGRYIMEYRHTGRTFRIPLVKTASSRIAVPRKDMESIPSGPFTVNVFLVPEKTVEYILYIEDMEIIPVPLKLRN